MKKTLIFLTTIYTTGICLAQGILTPTNAPIATMKTLQQAEPRIDISTVAGNAVIHHVINKSGSYYLSKNLDVTKSIGISIQATNVTIDLYGFMISRVAGNSGSGIVIKPEKDNATIKNGTIKKFLYGILSEYSPRYAEICRFENLTICESVSAAAVTSALYAGNNSIISRCRIYNNPRIGITVENNSFISDCVIYNNNYHGIIAGDHSTIQGCIIYNNNGSGIIAGASSKIYSSVLYKNNTGINVGILSTISDCTSLNNNSYAIFAGQRSTITRCTSYLNYGQYGIYAKIGTTINTCNSSYNTILTPTKSAGIYAESGTVIYNSIAANNSNTNPPAASNQGMGINIQSGTIKNCVTMYNSGDGILAESSTKIDGNMTRQNGRNGIGAGIHTTGTGNYLRNNSIVENDIGIGIAGLSTIITQNFLSDNAITTSIAGGNYTATITNNAANANIWCNFTF